MSIDDHFFLAAMADFKVKRREQRRIANLLQLLEIEFQEWRRRQEEKKGKLLQSIEQQVL